jgi:hypothetical protein
MSGFDYTAVGGDNTATDLRAAASRVREIGTKSAIEAGHVLIEVKEKLEEGLFTRWVKQECGIQMRTAQNMMAAARFAERYREAKTFSSVPLSAMYLLGAIEDDAKVNKVLEAYGAEKKPSVRKVKEMLGITAPPKARADRSPRPSKGTVRNKGVVQLAKVFGSLTPEDQLNTVSKLLSDDGGAFAKVSPYRKSEFIRELAETLGVNVTIGSDLSAPADEARVAA